MIERELICLCSPSIGWISVDLPSVTCEKVRWRAATFELCWSLSGGRDRSPFHSIDDISLTARERGAFTLDSGSRINSQSTTERICDWLDVGIAPKQIWLKNSFLFDWWTCSIEREKAFSRSRFSVTFQSHRDCFHLLGQEKISSVGLMRVRHGRVAEEPLTGHRIYSPHSLSPSSDSTLLPHNFLFTYALSNSQTRHFLQQTNKLLAPLTKIFGKTFGWE